MDKLEAPSLDHTRTNLTKSRNYILRPPEMHCGHYGPNCNAVVKANPKLRGNPSGIVLLTCYQNRILPSPIRSPNDLETASTRYDAI